MNSLIKQINIFLLLLILNDVIVNSIINCLDDLQI
jgi:hypothetical protein